MTWFSLSLSSVVFFTVLSVLSRPFSQKSEDPRAMSVVFNLSAILMTIIIFFATGQHRNFQLTTNPSAWLGLGTGVLFYGLYERVRFFSSKYMEASMLTIVGTLSVVIAFVISIFLYDEKLTFMKLAGAFFILSSIVVVSFNGKTKISKTGWFYGILSSTILGIAWSVDKLGARNFNPETYNFIVWVGPFVFVYLFPRVKFREIKAEFKRIGPGVMVLAAANIIAYYFQLKALSIGEAIKVIPVVQLSVITTVLAGMVILNEKEHLFRKLTAAVIGLVGVYLLL
jgi:drug/metabolite transporter (DMT)-like permease